MFQSSRFFTCSFKSSLFPRPCYSRRGPTSSGSGVGGTHKTSYQYHASLEPRSSCRYQSSLLRRIHTLDTVRTAMAVEASSLRYISYLYTTIDSHRILRGWDTGVTDALEDDGT